MLKRHPNGLVYVNDDTGQRTYFSAQFDRDARWFTLTTETIDPPSRFTTPRVDIPGLSSIPHTEVWVSGKLADYARSVTGEPITREGGSE